MLALIGCLLAAASSLHAHEQGLYDIDHACISCDLEDMSAHGALPAAAAVAAPQVLSARTESVCTHIATADPVRLPIRAPPLNS